ncbi:MAG: thymidylate kinase [Oscillospiraceae bacterium]|nr:thymidylate kinase [Oscillospiraceae bacterium]
MGYLIAFDGIDASGKTTQAKMLEQKLRVLNKNTDVLYISFPDYQSESSSLVRLYLNGELGKNPSEVNAYAASSFFAADRYISYMKPGGWREFYGRENTVIIANRYTTANAVHQLAKLEPGENYINWNNFLDWLYDYEFNKLKIPKPDLTVLFDMPPEAALELIEERAKLTNTQKDIHETDSEYLKKCYEAGKYAAKYLGWEIISCCGENNGGVPSPRNRGEISGDLLKLYIDKTSKTKRIN